ncbi:MAG: hypothetical protein JXA11_03475 [Phycisphaerae bacterium]|nr:hypothetical protein [Phycisphaerae bacterium]
MSMRGITAREGLFFARPATGTPERHGHETKDTLGRTPYPTEGWVL